ncbi:hypothetical protein GCM10008960_10570 [Deinococcus sedimenti]|uniref:Uncharacterized protein n=1 Tax=Deinococcus sedimenti TaxID=1867090 RepID=A0ABQ2S0K0_9DEIO|nr:hypothetical protein GCM10008960_10570 [Deinococcus sedimenti]
MLLGETVPAAPRGRQRTGPVWGAAILPQVSRDAPYTQKGQPPVTGELAPRDTWIHSGIQFR